MPMNLFISVLLATSSFFSWAEKPLHANIVAHVLIDNYHNDLYGEIYLEKNHFAKALRAEADCEAAEMLSECGPSYVTQHLQMTLNGAAVAFTRQSMDIQQDYIIYRFHLGKADDCISQVTVHTDYMFDYDSHAVTRLRIKIDDEEKHYSLISTRKEITFSKK